MDFATAANYNAVGDTNVVGYNDLSSATFTWTLATATVTDTCGVTTAFEPNNKGMMGRFTFTPSFTTPARSYAG